jgi:hypothetical protein
MATTKVQSLKKLKCSRAAKSTRSIVASMKWYRMRMSTPLPAKTSFSALLMASMAPFSVMDKLVRERLTQCLAITPAKLFHKK